ncbi:MAG: outer membrane protein assembly factor BamB [Rhodothermales bacterium]|jgi:outer membrane protein assembly factor BamB
MMRNLVLFLCLAAGMAQAEVEGWLNWRGPDQQGVTQEKNLVGSWTIGGENHLWDIELKGRGTPVIAGDRVYSWGYRGEQKELREVLVCLDAKNGKIIWERYFTDFISDIIYDRYAIGSPTVDPDTGNIFLMTSPGLFVCLNPDGDRLWEHSMMETFGRLTFPNGRTGAPVIEGDFVIVRGITTNWGKQGPARDRFYAFDKRTGEPIWASTPGVGPRDSSFSHPVFADFAGKRVFYAGTGCGNIVCVNANTGDPLWRYQFATGGVNSGVLLYKDRVIAIHGKENLDTSEIGRMAAIKMNPGPDAGVAGPVVLEKDSELWRTHLSMFTSSPVLAGNLVFQVDFTGLLSCVNADNGKVLWDKKLGTAQIHASPLYGDGKLYVPIEEGSLHILEVSAKGAKELAKVHLDGKCIGSPACYAGQIYVHTTKRLYCFGKPAAPGKTTAAPKVTPGPAAKIRAIPGEVLLEPGESQNFRLQALDGNGLVIGDLKPDSVEWAKFIPPTAKVKVKVNGDFKDGVLTAGAEALPSAGAFKATGNDLAGVIRGRVLPEVPFEEDLERFDLTVDHPTDGVKFSYPPLPWIGARFKWEIRDLDGSKVLAKTLDRELFQRCTTYFGHADSANYTLSADLRTGGNRRIKSSVGLINQRYLIQLKGNAREIEITSNYERLHVVKPFLFKTDTWYRLKTRVDVKKDGSGIVRAKAWPRDEDEPAEWTIEATHDHAHTNGSPGLFGFAPQSKYRVYIDNIQVTPNK